MEVESLLTQILTPVEFDRSRSAKQRHFPLLSGNQPDYLHERLQHRSSSGKKFGCSSFQDIR